MRNVFSGLPRTKRTSRPNRDLHRALGHIRAKDGEASYLKDGDKVEVKHMNKTFFLSAKHFDDLMDVSDVNILIQSYETFNLPD